MKKIILPIFLFCLLFSNLKTNAQAVRDRGIIPVAVNLNLVLRFQILDGGNIEFVFNSIKDYSLGMGAAGAAVTNSVGLGVGTTLTADQQMYRTRFTVAASRRWTLNYGTEQLTFMGTDNAANTFPLDNVGITMTATGTHTSVATGVTSTQAGNFLVGGLTAPSALVPFPVALITDSGVAVANAGSADDNSFCIFWQCGSADGGGTPAMNAVTLLQQTTSPAPDRYITNVLFELDGN